VGVVYGDIGTGPLYALRECFTGPHGMTPTHENVLGVLSLSFWSLIITVSVKYLVFVVRADNRGEGGILALTALVSQQLKAGGAPRARPLLLPMGIFGAALLYGDGIITPAISVLSAFFLRNGGHGFLVLGGVFHCSVLGALPAGGAVGARP
jgi:KUP system potassium uptake protein